MRTAREKVKGESSHMMGGNDAGLAGDQPPKVDAGLPQKPGGEMKRTLTPDNVIATVANVVHSAPVLIGRPSSRESRLRCARRFLAVTSVNDCRYCKWGHTHFAMAQGVPLEEVNEILSHQLDSLEAKNAGEAAAILFAQHYAEQLDQVDPERLSTCASITATPT